MSSRSSTIQRHCRTGALFVLASWLSGCGEDSKPPAEEPPDVEVTAEPLTTYEPCAVEEDLGEFYVDLAEDYTSVGGELEDRVLPVTLAVELANEGSCRLVTPPQFNCDPPCAFSRETCSTGDVCVPVSQGLDLGTVTVRGLSAAASMTPNVNTKSYSLAPPVPHPGYEPGATLELSATGGEYEPIRLRGWGVSLFELAEPPRVDPGMPTSLRWVTPEDPGPARITVNLNINLHGSSEAWIDCDFSDTGAAEIPAALIDGLVAQGVSGFPTLVVNRRSASSVQIGPGCVEFLVRSEVRLDVTFPGLVSCDTNTPCPDGLICTPELFCE